MLPFLSHILLFPAIFSHISQIPKFLGNLMGILIDAHFFLWENSLSVIIYSGGMTMSIGRVVKILKKLYLLIWLQIFTSVNYIGGLGVVGYIEGVGLV